MIDILFISIAFPPKNDPECLQTAKYFKYMARQKNVNLDVVTSAIPTLFMPLDNELLPYVTGVRQLIEIAYYENKYVNYLIRKSGLELLEKPDSKRGFIRRAAKASKQLRKKPQCIYSRSFPISSTIAAYHVVEHYNVPWILHLSDPWVDSPIHHYSSSVKKYHRRWEERCFDRATRICLSSGPAVDFYKAKYPQYLEKYLLFPNVYDPDDMSGTPHQFGEKLKFVYTGGLVEDRSPERLFNVLKSLYHNDPMIAEKIEFVFAGQLDRRNKAVFENSSLPFVQYLGPLSFIDSIKLQREADVLLLIDTPFKREEEALFLPSKLLDYFAAQRRILAITNRGSPAADLVDNKYGDWCLHTDLHKIERFVLDAISHFDLRDNGYFYFENTPPEFSADYNAERLIATIKDIL